MKEELEENISEILSGDQVRQTSTHMHARGP